MQNIIKLYSLKNIVISSVLFILSVSSVCAVSDVISSDAQQANLVIYRGADNSALNYRFSVAGKHLGKLKHGDKFSLKLTPGEYVISASDPKKSQLKVQVSNEQVTYVLGKIDRKSRLILQQKQATAFNTTL